MCDCLCALPPYGPGVYPNIPAEEYHRLPFVGSTVLKAFRECPASVWLAREATEDMNLGSAIHCWLLEGPGAFESRFAVMFESDLNKNTTEYKRLKAKFTEENEGKVILPAYPRGVDVPTMDVLRNVEDSLRSHPMAGLLLNHGGTHEVSMIWDDESGVRCKGRIDRDPGRKTIIELKKCADIDRFQYQIKTMGYDTQAGHFLNGSEAVGIEADQYIWLAVVAAPPYQVRTGYLDADGIDEVKHRAKRLVALYGECRERNYFPKFRIPDHLFSLNDLQQHDLLEEWSLR
jgi:hypothetical protein